jgi:hypothetical protein
MVEEWEHYISTLIPSSITCLDCSPPPQSAMRDFCRWQLIERR